MSRRQSAYAQSASADRHWVRCQVDVATGEGLRDAFDALGVVDVILNCAALSSPGQCQAQPQAAR